MSDNPDRDYVPRSRSTPSAARGAVHSEPDDETVLRWVARGRMLAELHFDHDYELQRIDQHRENYLRAFPPATLGAVKTPQPPDVDYWRKSLDLVADTLMTDVSETSDEKLAEKRDKLGAIVRMAVHWWRVTTGGPSAAEGQPEYYAELFEDCGHWKCDDVAKRHPELRPLAAEGPEPPPASEERRDPQ